MGIELCKIVDLPEISDERRNLSFIEGRRHVPLSIERVYYLCDAPGAAERGGHARKGLHQLIIAMSGSFDIIVDHGGPMKAEVRVGLDLDGTLTEPSARHKAALLQAASSVGVELPPRFTDTYYEEKRNGTSGKEVLLGHGIPRPEEISRAWIDLEEDACLLGMDRLYPFVINKLKEMISGGAQFYLVTARQHGARALRQVEALRISALMSHSFVVRISGKGESEIRKDELTRHLELNAVVGDSEVDQAWAQEAGAWFYAVECGMRCQRFWQRRGIVSYETTLLALEQLFRAHQESHPTRRPDLGAQSFRR